jgi:hypothetical protein
LKEKLVNIELLFAKENLKEKCPKLKKACIQKHMNGKGHGNLDYQKIVLRRT